MLYAKGTGKVRNLCRSKGRQPKGKIKLDLNRVGEKKKYVKSQKRSGREAHLVWILGREFLLHRLQSAPICLEAWFMDRTFRDGPNTICYTKQSVFNVGAEA